MANNKTMYLAGGVNGWLADVFERNQEISTVFISEKQFSNSATVEEAIEAYKSVFRRDPDYIWTISRQDVVKPMFVNIEKPAEQISACGPAGNLIPDEVVNKVAALDDLVAAAKKPARVRKPKTTYKVLSKAVEMAEVMYPGSPYLYEDDRTPMTFILGAAEELGLGTVGLTQAAKRIGQDVNLHNRNLTSTELIDVLRALKRATR